MKRLLNWFANRRRPDVVDAYSLTWRLTQVFGYTLSAVMVYRSDDEDDYRPGESSVWIVVLAGKMIVQSQPASMPRGWVTRFHRTEELHALDVDYYPAGSVVNFQLWPSMNYAEGMITMAWMEPTDRILQADQPVWLLSVERQQ